VDKDAVTVARHVFGESFDLAERFHQLLATVGISRGLLGPREAERLWDRHLVNCAVLTELLPEGARVVDVGSGAGLPGVVLAVRRPDLRVDLVESLQRRSEFLTDAVAELQLGSRVRVVRGRVEDATVLAAVGEADWVTARAVAPLDRLVRWCLPLLRPGGHLLAMKGATVSAEIADHKAAVRGSGADSIEIVQCGVGVLAAPTTVVSVRRGPTTRPQNHRVPNPKGIA
jgi:16S rRNA (guanine527-N7)-methyltransferase